MFDILCTLKRLQLSQTLQSLELSILKALLLLVCMRKLLTDPVQTCFEGGFSQILLLKGLSNLVTIIFMGL